MLKKIEYYYDADDHEQIDISDEKIYWDTNMNMFRHRFSCFYCGKLINCKNYKTLKRALAEVEERFICGTCDIMEALDVESVEELIEMLKDDRVIQVRNYIYQTYYM